MNAPAPPAWVRMAQSLHAASLYLFPRAFREAHGEDMKQAFRDRCREAVAAGRGPIALLLGEWLPDTLRAVPESHFSQPAFSSNPRQFVALGLLCLSLLALLSRDAISGWVLDQGFALRNQWREYPYQHELDRLEGITRAQAAALGRSTDPARRVLGASLFVSLTPDRVATVEVIGQGYPSPGWMGYATGTPKDGALARELLSDIASTTSFAPALATAVPACDPGAGCNRRALVDRLLAVDSGNGFAWELAYSEAARRGDATAQAAALHAMAGTTRYESYRAFMIGQLYAAATEFDDSQAHLAGVAWAQRRSEYGTLSDWYSNVRFACTPQTQNASSRPHWIDLHPESQADCARIATLLSGSGDLRSAMWATRRIIAGNAGTGIGDAARTRWRELAWLARNRTGWLSPDERGTRWTPWSEAEWARWVRQFRPDGGEVQAMRRWLADNRVPPHPPAWFMSDPH